MTATRALFECRECEWSWHKWYEYDPSPWFSSKCPKCGKQAPIKDRTLIAITVSAKDEGVSE